MGVSHPDNILSEIIAATLSGGGEATVKKQTFQQISSAYQIPSSQFLLLL